MNGRVAICKGKSKQERALEEEQKKHDHFSKSRRDNKKDLFGLSKIATPHLELLALGNKKKGEREERGEFKISPILVESEGIDTSSESDGGKKCEEIDLKSIQETYGDILRVCVAGDIFGERILENEKKRTATAVIFEDAELLVLNEVNYNKYFSGKINEEEISKLEIIYNLFPMIKMIPKENQLKIIYSIKETTVAPGEIILNEGDPANKFVIILEGEVQLTKKLTARNIGATLRDKYHLCDPNSKLNRIEREELTLDALMIKKFGRNPSKLKLSKNVKIGIVGANQMLGDECFYGESPRYLFSAISTRSCKLAYLNRKQITKYMPRIYKKEISKALIKKVNWRFNRFEQETVPLIVKEQRVLELYNTSQKGTLLELMKTPEVKNYINGSFLEVQSSIFPSKKSRVVGAENNIISRFKRSSKNRQLIRLKKDNQIIEKLSIHENGTNLRSMLRDAISQRPHSAQPRAAPKLSFINDYYMKGKTQNVN